MESGYIYRRETPADWQETETLAREAFWNVYQPGCDEHYLLHIMRGNLAVVERLNYVCVDGDKICGHIFYTQTRVISDDGRSFEMLTFGPLSVAPAYQRQGIGSHLVQMTLHAAANEGYSGIVITGNPKYYQRFGFRPAADFGITARMVLHFQN